MTLFPRRSNLPESAGYSVIDEHLSITGEISTEGTIRIDGRLEGRLHRAATLIVGASGTVIGDVEARDVVVGGTIEGNLVIDGRLELQATATIHGDVRARAMVLHEGATIFGHVAVSRAASMEADAPRLELQHARVSPALPG